MIEEGHEWLVHHIVVYACYDKMNVSIIEEAHGTNGHCYMDDDDDEADEEKKKKKKKKKKENNEKDYVERPMDKCETTIAAWAIGGGVREYKTLSSFFVTKCEITALLTKYFCFLPSY